MTTIHALLDNDHPGGRGGVWVVHEFAIFSHDHHHRERKQTALVSNAHAGIRQNNNLETKTSCPH